MQVDPHNTYIQYTIEDDGVVSHITLSLDEIENGELYAVLHDTERYTCIAKVIERKLVLNNRD